MIVQYPDFLGRIYDFTALAEKVHAAGALLGIVGVLAVWLADSLLGASGAFENLAGIVGKAAAPALFNNMYFNFIMPAQITWGVILIVGAIFGGMLGALSSKTWKIRANSDPQWRWWGPHSWETSGDAWSYEYRLWPQGVTSAPRLERH